MQRKCCKENVAKENLQCYLCIMSPEEKPQEAEPPFASRRELDLDSLKALAHPLRVRLLDTLSLYGAFTASGLAERLGESSGATSYHLRQLEKHGFVREVEGRGSARERWWERVPGGINLSRRDVIETPAGRAASDIVMAQWEQNRQRLLSDFVEHGFDELSPEWTEASAISTMNLMLTREQLTALVRLVDTTLEPFAKKYGNQQVPGARPVQVQFNAFPVLDGVEITDETSGERP